MVDDAEDDELDDEANVDQVVVLGEELDLSADHVQLCSTEIEALKDDLSTSSDEDDVEDIDTDDDLVLEDNVDDTHGSADKAYEALSLVTAHINESFDRQRHGWKDPLPTLLAIRGACTGGLAAIDSNPVTPTRVPFFGKLGPYIKSKSSVLAFERNLRKVKTSLVAFESEMAESQRSDDDAFKRASSAMFDMCHAYDHVFDLSERCDAMVIDEEACPVGVSQAPGKWVVDSGATVHITPHESDLSFVSHRPRKTFVRVANGEKAAVVAVGRASLKVNVLRPDGSHAHEVIDLDRVYVVPDIGNRLFSTKKGHKRDKLVTNLEDECLKLKSGARVPFDKGTRQYSFTPVADHVHVAHAAEHDDDGLINHKRLCHFGSGRVKGAGLHGDFDVRDCEGCMSNIKRAAVPKRSKVQRGVANPYTKFGQRVMTDLLKMPPSREGFEYLMTFVDSASSESAVRFLKDKSPEAVLTAMQSFVAEYKFLMDGGTVGVWHTDNGGEFESSDIDAFCNEMATRRTFSVPYTPEQNGKAERFNGILVRQIRIMLADANLSHALWPYAANQIANVHSRLTSRAHDPPISPYEFNRKRPPNLDIYKVWGCKCYVNIDKEDRAKLGLLKTESAAMEAVHLGYDHTRHGYYVYIRQLQRITVSRSVKFDERVYSVPPELARHDALPSANKRCKTADQGVTDPNPPNAIEFDDPPARPIGIINEVVVSEDGEALKVSDVGPIPIPNSFKEAMASEHASFWHTAMIEDLEGKAKNGPNGAWDEVDLEECLKQGRKPIKGKWVFTVKYESDGKTVKRFKARWVGCGYSQQEHIDYNETFASTIRATTVRVLIAEAAKNDYMLGMIDVVKAFTLSALPELVFVEMPQGFEKKGKVCKLNQALEGTKQAAHLWQKNLNGFMIEQGFERSLIDPCLYGKRVNESVLMCAVHVDDVLCAYNDSGMYEAFTDAFGKRFNSTVNKVDNYLGMEVTRDRELGTITLTQSVYIEKMFAKYLVGDTTKKWNTPVDTTHDGIKRFLAMTPAETEAEHNEMVDKDFAGLLGSLLYASCMTRPDISYYTSYLAQFMQRPTMAAWHAALSVAAYLNATATYGITFGGPGRSDEYELNLSESHAPRMWADGSFGNESYPYIGSFVEWRNGPVAWGAHKVKFVPTSSSHIELAALNTMVKEAIFTCNIASEIAPPGEVSGPIQCMTDNKATRDIIYNPGATKHTTHYERWLHYARDLRLKNKIEVILVTTDKMMADFFTKPVPKVPFFRCRDYMMTTAGRPIDLRSKLKKFQENAVSLVDSRRRMHPNTRAFLGAGIAHIPAHESEVRAQLVQLLTEGRLDDFIVMPS